MHLRLLLFFSAASIAAAPSAVGQTPLARQEPVAAQAASAAQAPHEPVIRFEDASDKAGIHFTHSFGSRQLGSLLEGTGAGCIWFDYNNSGFESLYVVNGRPLMTRCIRIRSKKSPIRCRTIIFIATTATAPLLMLRSNRD